MGGLPENAVLHPPHGVQFAIHAKSKIGSRNVSKVPRTD